MKWITFVLVMVVAILLVICYALLVIAHEADERAEEMYRAWKERKDE
jgi:cell division protein FtsX